VGWFGLGDVEWLGVAVATLAAFIVGFVWYHPRALGTAWARLANVDLAELRAGVATRAPIAVVALAATAVFMNVLQAELLVVSLTGGLMFGAFVGLVLRLLWALFHDAYEFRPMGLTVINAAHDIVALAVIGAVVGAFL
jgi:hypothetical protein